MNAYTPVFVWLSAITRCQVQRIKQMKHWVIDCSHLVNVLPELAILIANVKLCIGIVDTKIPLAPVYISVQKTSKILT